MERRWRFSPVGPRASFWPPWPFTLGANGSLPSFRASSRGVAHPDRAGVAPKVQRHSHPGVFESGRRTTRGLNINRFDVRSLMRALNYGRATLKEIERVANQRSYREYSPDRRHPADRDHRGFSSLRASVPEAWTALGLRGDRRRTDSRAIGLWGDVSRAVPSRF